MFKNIQKVLLFLLLIGILISIKDFDIGNSNFTLEKIPKQEENRVEASIDNQGEIQVDDSVSTISRATVDIESGDSQEYSDECDFLNRAPMDSLLEIKYIGKVTANKIIEYRNEKKYENVEELMNLKGIGSKKFNTIREGIIQKISSE
ncbi:MAG: helix-hairpin-helix domain-containing protein [Firmicutes bacterium]|jgi:competence protein ComEA|nr:helix-hairpin-helix domain-containing protein [Bacillota bacterium]